MERNSRVLPKLAIVVPCYNEQEGLNSSVDTLLRLIDRLNAIGKCKDDSFVVLVDDGSYDDTWKIIEAECERAPGRVVGIKLAVNCGHQNALVAGIDYATTRSDISISIDADLQDDLDAMDRMIDAYRDGSELVLGVKRQRTVDSTVKRLSAKFFYKLMTSLGIKVQAQHADFRLMSSSAMRNFSHFPEYHLFLRGFPHLLHSKVTTVTYDIRSRQAGDSKYTFRKMLSLALNGITSFSVAPLRVITIVGFLIFAASTVLSLLAVIDAFRGKSVPGWASITVPLYFLGGMIMLSIGIVGEYTGKMYIETKKRPRYLVDQVVNLDASGVTKA